MVICDHDHDTGRQVPTFNPTGTEDRAGLLVCGFREGPEATVLRRLGETVLAMI